MFNPPQQVADSKADPLSLAARDVWLSDTLIQICVLVLQSKCPVHMWSEAPRVRSTGSQSARSWRFISPDGSGHSL